MAAAFDDAACSPSWLREAAADRRTATSVGKGHGRRERRAGVTVTKTAYSVTSLTHGRTDAGRRLGLVRAHWSVEDGLHHVWDVTLREDAGRVRRGAAPQVLAGLRNAAVHLLSGLGRRAWPPRRGGGLPRRGVVQTDKYMIDFGT